MGINIFWECLHFFCNNFANHIYKTSFLNLNAKCSINTWFYWKKSNELIRVSIQRIIIIIRSFFLFNNKANFLPNNFIWFMFVHKHLALCVIYITTINDWIVMMERWKKDCWCLETSFEQWAFESSFYLNAEINSINLSIDRKQSSNEELMKYSEQADNVYLMWMPLFDKCHVAQWTLNFIFTLRYFVVVSNSSSLRHQLTNQPKKKKRKMWVEQDEIRCVLWRNDCNFACVTLPNNQIIC